jgi:hypothetical protein
MFGFLRAPAPRSPSAAICRVIEQSGLPAWIGRSSMLRVVESRGRYAGRPVTFIRVFDPVRAAEREVVVQRFRDLDTQPSLVLWSGHVERDGLVALSRRSPGPDLRPSTRSHADRTAHADDAHLVFRGQHSETPREMQ